MEVMLSKLSTIPFVDYTINSDDLLSGVKHIVSCLCPTLQTNEFDPKIQRLSGGCCNHMYKVTSSKPELNNDINAVLVRIHMDSIKNFFDHEKEYQFMQFLHERGLHGKVYGRFRNGVCYQYQVGKTLNLDDVHDAKISKLIAQHLAQFHATARHFPSTDKTPPNHPKVIQEILERLPIQYADPVTIELAKQLYPDLTEFKHEFDYLMSYPEMKNIHRNQPLVMVHNDLLPANILFNNEDESVHIIDLEFAAWGYAVDDIGTHFLEFMGWGLETIDWSKYPSEESQLKWIRIYLETWNALVNNGQTASEAEVWNFYVLAARYSLIKDWMILAYILAAEEHTVDYYAQVQMLQFDSFRCGRKRLDIHRQRRDKVLALQLLPTY